jgi:hypothetical protein
MTHAGRKPEGPALVRRLDGSDQAKQRLETILATIAGRLSIAEACRALGVEHSMFFRLRTEVLEAGLAQLEPRPRGRPPRVSLPAEQRCTALAQRVEELEADLKIAAVREEVARILPRSGMPAVSGKKTTRGKSRKSRRRAHDKSRRP